MWTYRAAISYCAIEVMAGTSKIKTVSCPLIIEVALMPGGAVNTHRTMATVIDPIRMDLMGWRFTLSSSSHGPGSYAAFRLAANIAEERAVSGT